MKKTGIILFAILALSIAACNNTANNTSTTDSTSIKKDNTNMYDTGMGSSMTDTSKRNDTLPRK